MFQPKNYGPNTVTKAYINYVWSPNYQTLHSSSLPLLLITSLYIPHLTVSSHLLHLAYCSSIGTLGKVGTETGYGFWPESGTQVTSYIQIWIQVIYKNSTRSGKGMIPSWSLPICNPSRIDMVEGEGSSCPQNAWGNCITTELLNN